MQTSILAARWYTSPKSHPPCCSGPWRGRLHRYPGPLWPGSPYAQVFSGPKMLSLLLALILDKTAGSVKVCRHIHIQEPLSCLGGPLGLIGATGAVRGPDGFMPGSSIPDWKHFPSPLLAEMGNSAEPFHWASPDMPLQRAMDVAVPSALPACQDHMY